MRLVVSDSGVFHALQKASLLRAALTSQDDIVVSDVLFRRALAPEGFSSLPKEGLLVEEVAPSALNRAHDLRCEQPGLSVTDALAVTLAFPSGGRLLSQCRLLCGICRGKGWPCHDAGWLIARITAAARNEVTHPSHRRAS